jgi:hypothetical protein
MNSNTNEPGVGVVSMIAHDKNAGPLKGWHLDKRITVSHLFTTLAFALAIGGVLYAQDVRLTIVENDVANVSKDVVAHSAIVNAQIASQEKQFQIQMDAVKEMDRQMILQQNAHFNDIIARLSDQTRRLERIEDGVQRHVETAHE